MYDLIYGLCKIGFLSVEKANVLLDEERKLVETTLEDTHDPEQ